MRRLAAPAALLVLLAACTAAPPPDPGPRPDEVDAWFGERSRESTPDALGAATGRVDPADDELDQPADAGITLTYPEPAGLTGVRLSCFGPGSLDFEVHVTTASSRRTYAYADLACDDEVDQAIAADDVTDVRVDAAGADHAGAWHAVVLGQEG